MTSIVAPLFNAVRPSLVVAAKVSFALTGLLIKNSITLRNEKEATKLAALASLTGSSRWQDKHLRWDALSATQEEGIWLSL